jgi:hypothetical protein
VYYPVLHQLDTKNLNLLHRTVSIAGGSECFKQNRLPYGAEYMHLSASSTVRSQIPINSSCQIGSSQNSYGWIFLFIEVHIKNPLGSTCTPKNTRVLKTLLGHKGLTNVCIRLLLPSLQPLDMPEP